MDPLTALSNPNAIIVAGVILILIIIGVGWALDESLS